MHLVPKLRTRCKGDTVRARSLSDGSGAEEHHNRSLTLVAVSERLREYEGRM